MKAKDMAVLVSAECDCKELDDDRIDFLTIDEYNRGEYPKCSVCGKLYSIDPEYNVMSISKLEGIVNKHTAPAAPSSHNLWNEFEQEEHPFNKKR